jgi:hypothetical protein
LAVSEKPENRVGKKYKLFAMALTSNSDVFARFHESGFNTIINEIMLQRPKIFNYATQNVLMYNGFCSPITVNPILASMGIEKCTIVDKFPIAGAADNSTGIDYCVQIKELQIDFQPSNQIQLPPELGNLALQQFALKGRVCAGMNCGGRIKSKKTIRKLEDLSSAKITGLDFHPFDILEMICFCLDLYAKVVIIRENNFLKIKIFGIELQEITPVGLENTIECYLKQMLDSVVLPKMQIAIEDLVFNAGSYFSLGLTPISTAVPYNPDVSNDSLSLFINLT